MTRVVFLGRLAKEDVTKRLQSISDVDLFVSEDMDEILRELPGAEVFVTADVRGDNCGVLCRLVFRLRARISAGPLCLRRGFYELRAERAHLLACSTTHVKR